jgi:hypothetical protein
MSEAIVNKVSESGLITLDLERYYPKDEVVLFDLKDYLFMGLILKEKDFREALKNLDWGGYRNKYVGVTVFRRRDRPTMGVHARSFLSATRSKGCDHGR